MGGRAGEGDAGLASRLFQYLHAGFIAADDHEPTA